MSESSMHICQAKHNGELLTHLCEIKKEAYFCDWYITIAFYASLHFVESVIFKKRVFNINKNVSVKGSHSSNFKKVIGTNSEHVVRSTLIYNNPDIFDKFYIPYGNLYEMSRIARYNCYETPSNGYIDAEIHLSDIKQAHDKICS